MQLSAGRHPTASKLTLPRLTLCTEVWNELLDSLRNIWTVDSLTLALKTFLFYLFIFFYFLFFLAHQHKACRQLKIKQEMTAVGD